MVYQRMFSEFVDLWLRVKRAMQLTAMSFGCKQRVFYSAFLRNPGKVGVTGGNLI